MKKIIISLFLISQFTCFGMDKYWSYSNYQKQINEFNKLNSENNFEKAKEALNLINNEVKKNAKNITWLRMFVAEELFKVSEGKVDGNPITFEKLNDLFTQKNNEINKEIEKIQKVVSEKVPERVLDIAIVLTKKYEEFKSGTVSIELADLIKQKVVPVITNAQTFYNVLFGAKEAKSDLGSLLHNYSNILEKSSKTKEDQEELSKLEIKFWREPKDNKHQFLFASAQFSFNDWEIYKSAISDLYLLMPKSIIVEADNFIKQHKSSFEYYSKKLDLSEKEIALGLEFENPKIAKKVNSQGELETALLRFSEYSETINIDALKGFFVEGKEDIFGKWIVFLSGHGICARTEAGAQIAGLNLEQFNNLLSFFLFNSKLAMFYYATCFSGGYNLDLVSRYLFAESEKITPKIPGYNIITVGSLTDVPVMITETSIKNIVNSINKGYLINYKKFFTTINELFTNFNEAKLEEALGNGIYELFPDPTAIPYYWKPGSNEFKLLTNKDVIFLKDNNPGSIVNKKAIFIQKEKIDYPLEIINDALSGLPQLFSLLPGKARHSFEKIDVKYKVGDKIYINDITSILRGSLINNIQSFFEKYFLIKNLKCTVFREKIFEKYATKINFLDVVNFEDVLIKKYEYSEAKEFLGEVTLKIKDKDGTYKYFFCKVPDYFVGDLDWKEITEQEAKAKYKEAGF